MNSQETNSYTMNSVTEHREKNILLRMMNIRQAKHSTSLAEDSVCPLLSMIIYFVCFMLHKWPVPRNIFLACRSANPLLDISGFSNKIFPWSLLIWSCLVSFVFDIDVLVFCRPLSFVISVSVDVLISFCLADAAQKQLVDLTRPQTR